MSDSLVNNLPKYLIKHSPRAKWVSLRIDPIGELTVIAPLQVSKDRIHYFLNKKRAWILSKQRLFAKRRALHARSGGLTVPKGSARDYLAHKEQARTLAKERLAYFSGYYGLRHDIVPNGRIAIKNHRSRWGSCSARGNLNFNYRIIYLPPELQDYLVVHELCHLKEMNHSPRFWALVAEQIPEYRTLRTKLAHTLHV